MSVSEAGDGGDSHLLELDDLLAPAVHLLVALLEGRLAHHQTLLFLLVLKTRRMTLHFQTLKLKKESGTQTGGGC